MTAAPKRGRGRPPIGGGAGAVEIKLAVAAPLHADLVLEAERRGMTLADLVREAIALHVEHLRQAPRRRAR